MGRKSSIEILGPELKTAVDDALRRGIRIIDIVELVRGMGGEVSKSAVGRYKASFDASLARYRDAQEVAGKWVSQFHADPGSDVGRLLAEMCKTLAFQTLAVANDAEDAVDGLELGRLARAVKALTDVDRVKAELETRVRREIAAEAADKAAEVGHQAGLSADAVARIRREVLGLRGAPAEPPAVV